MTTVRVIVPDTARKGEPFEIKALIAHPMETGFRKDTVGDAIPRDILTGFTCHYDGEEVFAWELHPGVAANPFDRREPQHIGGTRHEAQHDMLIALPRTNGVENHRVG